MPNSSINPGDIYAGELLSKDRSSHHKAIIYVVSGNGIVYSFALTSEKETIDYYNTIDHSGVVELPESLVNQLYSQKPTKTWVYCGKENINETPLITVSEALKNGEIKKLNVKIGQALYDKIDDAVYYSNSYSEDERNELGF